MSNDYEIFKGKSLSSLFQDIYENQNYNRKQLDVLTRNITSMIKDGDTAVQIVPMIKEYLEINVRNDELLVKLASIVQKIISTENKGESESEFGLSEIEKQFQNLTILQYACLWRLSLYLLSRFVDADSGKDILGFYDGVQNQ